MLFPPNIPTFSKPYNVYNHINLHVSGYTCNLVYTNVCSEMLVMLSAPDAFQRSAKGMTSMIQVH